MMLRKLTAAVIASAAMTSGAWAQSDDEAVTTVNLLITAQFEADAVSSLNFAQNASSADSAFAYAESGLCTWSNTDFDVDVLSANNWVMVGQTSGNTDTISYQLKIGSTIANATTDLSDGTGPYNTTDDDIKLSSVPCANGGPQANDYAELIAILTTDTTLTRADSYSDTVTFTVGPI
jgi:hypothetical protein